MGVLEGIYSKMCPLIDEFSSDLGRERETTYEETIHDNGPHWTLLWDLLSVLRSKCLDRVVHNIIRVRVVVVILRFIVSFTKPSQLLML